MRELPCRQCFAQLGRDTTRAGQCVCCADDGKAKQHAGNAPQRACGHCRREGDGQRPNASRSKSNRRRIDTGSSRKQPLISINASSPGANTPLAGEITLPRKPPSAPAPSSLRRRRSMSGGESANSSAPIFATENSMAGSARGCARARMVPKGSSPTMQSMPDPTGQPSVPPPIPFRSCVHFRVLVGRITTRSDAHHAVDASNQSSIPLFSSRGYACDRSAISR